MPPHRPGAHHLLRAAASSSRVLATRLLVHVFATRFTITRRRSPRTSTYTSTILRAVLAASAAFSPAVVPYLCETAAVTAAPPASTSRTDEASSAPRMSAAESARLVRVRRGWGDWPREGVARRGGSAGLVSGGAGEGPRLRGGSDAAVGCGDGTALPLPLLALEELALPMARSIKPSTAAVALLLSLTALPLTVWMRSRCLRVVGDCRMRSVRDGGAGGGGEDEDGVFDPFGVVAVVILLEVVDVDGVERAMYKFEAVAIALVSRVVVPEMAWLNRRSVSERVEWHGEKDVPDEDGPLHHPVTVFGRDSAYEDLLVQKPIVGRVRTFRQLNNNRVSLMALLHERRILTNPNRSVQRTDDLPIALIHQHKPPTEIIIVLRRSRTRSFFDQSCRRRLRLQLAVDTEVRDIPYEHAVEELDVVGVRVWLFKGELDGELSVILRGVEDVAPSCAAAAVAVAGGGRRLCY